MGWIQQTTQIQSPPEIQPSFWLESCAWDATDIVVATAGSQIDGGFTVIESWKGDLKPGQDIVVSELASFEPPSSRIIQTFSDAEEEEPVEYVTGSRMILFLKRKAEGVRERGQAAVQAAGSVVWGPASSEGVKASVVWVEEDQTFAFYRPNYHGRSLLTDYDMSEYEIRARVLDLTRTRNWFDQAMAIPEPSIRAEELGALGAHASLAALDLYFARKIVFGEIQKCGEPALPTLRRMLRDQSLLRVHPEVVESLAVAGGEKVGDELTALIREEMEFWKAIGPSLKKGWWNNIPQPDTYRLRDRYGKVYAALVALRKLRFAGCKEVVAEFRDFWRSLPQLEDKTGLNQMSQECDEIWSELAGTKGVDGCS